MNSESPELRDLERRKTSPWQLSLTTLFAVVSALCVQFAIISSLGFRYSTALVVLVVGTHMGIIGFALGRSWLALSGVATVLMSATMMLVLDTLL